MGEKTITTHSKLKWHQPTQNSTRNWNKALTKHFNAQLEQHFLTNHQNIIKPDRKPISPINGHKRINDTDKRNCQKLTLGVWNHEPRRVFELRRQSWRLRWHKQVRRRTVEHLNPVFQQRSEMLYKVGRRLSNMHGECNNQTKLFSQDVFRSESDGATKKSRTFLQNYRLVSLMSAMSQQNE